MKRPHFQPVFNLFCRDIDVQTEFYAGILGWPEVLETASPIYRGIAQGDTRIGFHTVEAYGLLGLSERQKRLGEDQTVGSLLTFVTDSHEGMDELISRIVELGGTIIKQPFATYYDHWQVVFQDPEGNIARISGGSLPEGVTAPTLESLLPGMSEHKPS